MTAWLRVLTLTRRMPLGTAPLVSAQLLAGVRKMVAPALRAPIIFCWMPPMGCTWPLAVISPVPAMNRPAVRSSLVSLSMMPSANIMPALGPPMSPTLILTWNGNLYSSVICTPITGCPPDCLVPTWNWWL